MLLQNFLSKFQIKFMVSWWFPSHSSLHGVKAVTWTKTLLSVQSVQLLSHVQLCNPMNCSTPGLPVYHQLLEFTQTHVHWFSPTIQPSHPLSFSSPPTLKLSQHQGFFPMSQFFTPGGQSIRVSSPASVLPMNIQDWFPLGWTLLWITLYFWCFQMWISLPSFKNVFTIFLIIKYIYKYK